MIILLTKCVRIIRLLFFSKKNSTNNIIILSFKFFGDTVFTIPAIRLIKKIFPNHKIIVLCYESNKQIYELEFLDLEYLVFDKKDLELENRTFNLNFFRAKKKIDCFNAEYLFDFTSNYKTALLSLFTKIRKSYGFGNKLLSGFYNNFNDKTANSAFNIFLNLVQSVDHNMEYKDCLEFKENFSKQAEILFLPSSGWNAKEWGKRNFIHLINKINLNYRTKLVSEPGFFASDVLDYILKNKIKYIITENLNALIDEIRSCSIIVSNDTGPIYIAALLGHPTYTIFGPTGPLFHKISGENHRFIRKELKCSPSLSDKLCFTFGGRIGCPSNECMQLLKVDDVYIDLEKFLDNLNITKLTNEC